MAIPVWERKEHVGPIWMDGHLLFSKDSHQLFNRVNNEFGRKYRTLEVALRKVSGHLEIGLSGEFRDVYHCIRTEWHEGDCENEQERMLATLSDMGDELALHRWNTGCKLGLPIDGFAKSTPEDSLSDLDWERHWNATPSSYTGGGERDTEVAIELLVATGRTPSDDSDYDPVVIAQSYLELAFAHVPELVDVLEVAAENAKPITLRERIETEMVEYMKAGDLINAFRHLKALRSLSGDI